MSAPIIRLNPEVKNKITRPIAPGLIKQRDGGSGKQLSYISGSTVTDMLNDAFGYLWNWEVVHEFMQESEPWFNKYSKVPESEKVPHNGNKGSWEKQAPVAHVRGRLTVFFVDESGTERKLIKEGYGSKSVIGKQNEQESVYKAAGTDALKKAASLLGIGLELYRDEEEKEFFYEINYEDPWTDELRSKHSESLEFIKEFMSGYELTPEDMAAYTLAFSDNALESLDYITPDVVDSFVEYLKEEIKAAEAAQAKATE